MMRPIAPVVCSTRRTGHPHQADMPRTYHAPYILLDTLLCPYIVRAYTICWSLFALCASRFCCTSSIQHQYAETLLVAPYQYGYSRMSQPTPRPTPTRRNSNSNTQYNTSTLYHLMSFSRGMARPDDLVFDQQGRILFSDFYNGTISRFNADRSVTMLLHEYRRARRLIVLSDGTMIIAEQRTNRILALPPGATNRPLCCVPCLVHPAPLIVKMAWMASPLTQRPIRSSFPIAQRVTCIV